MRGFVVVAVLLSGLWACGGDEDGSSPATGGGGNQAGGSTGTGGDGATTGSGGSGATGAGGTGGAGAAAPSCGELLLAEDFADDDLAGRGWFGGLNGAGYAVVADAELGANAYEMAFSPGAQSPGGTVNHEFAASEEITVRYQLRVGPTWQLTVPHHLIMLHSNRDVNEGNGSPANAFGATYMEWEWNDAGIFIGKFQDNRASNCSYGYQDLTLVTEDRSVGGYQTFDAPAGQVASVWGDPCQDGIDAYTGQSVLTLHTNGAVHAMTQDEWWSVTVHLRKNTIQGGIGAHDGAFRVAWQGPNDATAVMVMDFENVLWRAGGWSQDLAWAKFMITPYLHDGATGDMWVRIADIQVNQGDCLDAG